MYFNKIFRTSPAGRIEIITVSPFLKPVVAALAVHLIDVHITLVKRIIATGAQTGASAAHIGNIRRIAVKAVIGSHKFRIQPYLKISAGYNTVAPGIVNHEIVASQRIDAYRIDY
jgi:hypothetical protein